jgi:hypothetical protein
MTRITFATWVAPPPVPVTVTVNDPVGAFDGNVSVRVESKLGVPDGTLKAAFTPDGNPEVVKETCELNPFSAATWRLNETICP